MDQETHQGRCLCGALVFAVDGPPRDVINCHCRFCQRATGSAYLVETTFLREDFRLLAGEPAVYTHVSEGSGKAIRLHFCARCGTRTHMTFERFPAIVGLFSGCFEQPDWFARRRENALHFFLSTAPLGTVLPAGFEVYDAHYWAAEGRVAVPQVFDAPVEVTEALRQAARDRLA
jgi:Uncharacterized conserved protein